MPRPAADDRLDRAVDRALRAFARVGAVAVAAVAVAVRSRRGHQVARALNARLAQADRLSARYSPALDTFAQRALALLDRLFAARGKWHL